MKQYFSLLKIRIINGLQYRAAAWAGVATQFAWGGMQILMFSAFYKSNSSAFPMSFSALSSYIWLQQAFLAMFMAWLLDNDILNSITSGSIAYELCRPVDLYSIWYVKNIAMRLSMVALRCVPILIVVVLLPAPYNISPPASVLSGVLFIISLFLGFFVLIAFLMLIYISAFYTVSPLGVRILSTSIVEFFSGAVIPLPFFPAGLQKIFYLFPFASMQNTPFQIYNGYLSGKNVGYSIALQVFWLTILIFAGRMLMKKALRRVVIQGG